jgi:hypothetical protein
VKIGFLFGFHNWFLDAVYAMSLTKIKELLTYDVSLDAVFDVDKKPVLNLYALGWPGISKDSMVFLCHASQEPNVP